MLGTVLDNPRVSNFIVSLERKVRTQEDTKMPALLLLGRFFDLKN